MLTVCECFKSIQGETTHAGTVCTFVRLSGCNLRCIYCDTTYALVDGTAMSVEAIMQKVDGFGCRLVEITGGEPLLQEETPLLCRKLIDADYTVLVETNGSLDISVLPAQCCRIVDVKCPGSGYGDSFFDGNIDQLRMIDECKMVLCDREDFLWAHNFVKRYRLADRCTVLFSPVTSMLQSSQLARWIIDSDLQVRLNLQLHTYIWGKNARGV
ncbi:MAG: radical SAM protein [Chitinivibrionales bacterium]|nr:radical SAM protein [Chitinivibrionales bacterium]